MNTKTAKPNTNVVHPWHGIDPYIKASDLMCVFIEIVPGDDLKFELDKPSGWLRIDRPQKFSSRPPVLYGLIPQTYCGDAVGQRCSEATGLAGIKGDGDPMDIVVLSEKYPPQGGFLAHVRLIGGLRMIDGNEADDKIIAVLDGDPIYGGFAHISEVPIGIRDRLVHYFTSYKQLPSDPTRSVTIEQIYDREEAQRVVTLSVSDYKAHFSKSEG